MRHWLFWIVIAGLLVGIPAAASAAAKDMVRFGNLTVEEEMEVRDAVAIGGSVTVDGKVERNVVAVGGSVLLTSNAMVGGNAVALGGIIEQEEGSWVQGSTVELAFPSLAALLETLHSAQGQALPWIVRGISFLTSLALLILSLLIVFLIPRTVGTISATIEKDLWKAGVWGLLAVLLIAPLGLLLALSIVGILLIPLEILFVISAVTLGYIAVAQLLGKKVTHAFRRPNQPIFYETLLGLILLWVFGWIPFLGWLVKSIASLLGLGGVIASLLSLRKR